MDETHESVHLFADDMCRFSFRRHCQHFKPKYIQFGRTMKKIADQVEVDIEIHAISCTAHHDLCRKQDVHSFPTILLFPAHQTNATRVDYYSLHPFFILQQLGIQVDQTTKVPVPGSASKSTAVVVTKKNKVIRTKKDLFNDAFLSFDFAMRNSVFMSNGALLNKPRKALHEWTMLLAKALPPTWKIQPMIAAIRDNIDKAAQGEDALLEIIDEHRPIVKEWSRSCTKGEPTSGYTCGLWELFHVMTIGAYEWNNVATTSYAIVPVSKAANTLHDYIANFFACDECRRNFLTEYDACAHDRCTRLGSSATDDKEWKELALWLWETHNAVNVRLMKEQAERDNRLTTIEDERRVQWPSRQACPKCWFDTGSWDEEVVFKYLRYEYW